MTRLFQAFEVSLSSKKLNCYQPLMQSIDAADQRDHKSD